jgi:hypothetical protein
MSKVISVELFDLIQSLSKSEKRFFKLYSQRIENSDTKKFLMLFDIIGKQSNYDEVAILNKYEIFTPKQFPSLKVHLYKEILKSLSIVNAKATIDIKIHYQMGQAQLLYNRCLYGQSLKILGKAKKIALQNDRNILLLDILELEKMIMIHTISARTQEGIDTIIIESKKISDMVNSTNTFSNLSLKMNALYMNLGFVRNKLEFDKVRDFFFSAIPEYQEVDLTFHDKLYLYYSYTGYFFFINEIRRGYFYAKKMLDLFINAPHMIENKLEMYIKAINNLLVAQNKLYLLSEFTETKKMLIAIKRFPKSLLNENINLNLFKTIYIHEINRHFLLGEFRSGTRIISKLDHELLHFLPRLDQHTIMLFYYKIACLYFGSDQYNQSLKWLNKIVSIKENNLREDLHAFSRMLSLICHYELDNLELIQYSIRSMYRFLLKKGELSQYNYYLIKFIKSLNSEMTHKQLLKQFTLLKSELIPLETILYEKRHFLYFDIISWLECKIKGVPVETIIKDKAAKKLK